MAFRLLRNYLSSSEPGSGKTTFMAALSLALMMVGSNNGNDILVFANTKEQAKELFTAAVSMIN